MVTWHINVPKPEPVDDELLSSDPGSGSRPVLSRADSKTAFYVHTLEMSDILYFILESV